MVKAWLRKWLGLEAFQSATEFKLSSHQASIEALEKQLDDLRRVVATQPKAIPAIKQAQTWREVEAFMGDPLG